MPSSGVFQSRSVGIASGEVGVENPRGVLFSYRLETTMPGEAKGWAGGGVGSENSSLPFLGALTYG